MTANHQELQKDLLNLSLQERLRLAYWLIETVLPQSSAFLREADIGDEKASNKVKVSANPLLQLAGRFAGGPGDTAENAEEILQSEVNPTNGLSR